MNLKEPGNPKTGPISAFLTAITLIGVIGLGIMLGGALALRREANLGEDLVAMFMFLTFLVVTITEVLLVRQLSRLTGEERRPPVLLPQSPARELQPAPARALADPITSVTENTTRTLEYSSTEQMR